MPRHKVIITGGRVHNVAYRPFLLSVAEGFEINRFFAKNVKKDKTEIVEALIEGDADKIERFKEHILKNFPENASVDDVAFSDYDGPVMSVESFYRYLTASQLSKIAGTGVSLLKTTKGISEKQDSMLDKQDSMLDKQDSMLDKQDSMLEKQDSMLDKQDSMLDKQDALKSAVDHGFSELKHEHIKTREMSMEIFHSEVQELRQEINFLRSSVEEIRKKVGIA